MASLEFPVVNVLLRRLGADVAGVKSRFLPDPESDDDSDVPVSLICTRSCALG